MKRPGEYPPIADYALIGDCHSAALVSRQGSIDWCCLPRFDSDSCFGRLLDWSNGGYFQICPVGHFSSRREYLEKSLVLVTTFRSGGGEARLIDFFAMRAGGRQRPRREIVRIIAGVSGTLRLHVRFVPRLDFGEVKPWIRPCSGGAHVAVGSNAGLMVFGDAPLHAGSDHDLEGVLEVHARSRYHFGLQFLQPEQTGQRLDGAKEAAQLEQHHEETRRWWRQWSAKIRCQDGRADSGGARPRTMRAVHFARASGTAGARSAVVL
jgi:GH15 family glucan-1,4-alpha-glucosidase